MNWLVIVSHRVAQELSYYNAGLDYPDSVANEARSRSECSAAWRECRAALVDAGIYNEFFKAGSYLI